MKRVLILAPKVPEFDRESGSRRIFHLIELLNQAGWSVTFAAQYGDGARDRRYLKTLQQMGVTTFAEIDSLMEKVVSVSQFDVAIFAFWYLAEQYIPAMRRISPNTRIIVDSIDLHFLREARQLFLAPQAALDHSDGRRHIKRHDNVSLTASPNPIPSGFGSGRTTISWDLGTAGYGQVYVSHSGAPDKLFSEGCRGSQEIDWISGGVDYEFRLYAGTTRETLLATQTVCMERGSAGLDKAYGAKAIRELNTYASADGVLTVSNKEAELICDLTGEPMLAHSVPDFDDLSASTVPMHDRKGILFVGNFKHTPNVDAVEYLFRDIVPKVNPALLEKHPIYVVGNALDGKIRSYAENLPHVRMTGWVPAVEPYLERARISIAPLRYGAGTKRKLLHSLMVGSPTVTTSVGVEGLAVTDGEDVLVADTPEAFAEAITRLLEDVELSEQLVRNGQRFASKLHGRETALSDLERVITTVLQKPAKCPPPRPMDALPHPQQKYLELLDRIRDAVEQKLPRTATVLVISKGDDELLKLDGRRAWHFPQTEHGGYSGHHPADSHAAIDQLESLRKQGADYLLLPETAYWWLDHYRDFQKHLDRHCSVVFREVDTCVIYSLKLEVDEPQSNHSHHLNGKSRVRINDVPVKGDTRAAKANARLIALYLPQFYPTAENNKWWGEGFTEWTNVVKARPLFEGHSQPHLPSHLGFYDLRTAEARQAQATMARSYGIEGFCYWHYWFHGKRLLDRPFDEVLSSGEPDFPFCLSWANETWSRRWHGSGGSNEVLQEQRYSAADDVEHTRWLVKAFADPRYIRVHGRPLFLIYRPTDLPDSQRTTDTIREGCLSAGLPEPYLVGMNSHRDLDYRTLGFDATHDFEPQLGVLPGYDQPGLKTYDYVMARKVMTGRQRDFPVHPSIFVRWDNTPRRAGNGIVFTDSTPENFETGLRDMVRSVLNKPHDERLVFINAWNEWAEGNHLEPDTEFGLAYLEATKRALLSASESPRRHFVRS